MAKDYAKSFYSSSKWVKTQAAYMMSRNYICERCGDMASIVHHKIYITPENITDPRITLDWNNLEALCQDCHNKEHHGSGACAAGLYFDSEGNIRKTE